MFVSALYFWGEKKVTVHSNQKRQLRASVTLVSFAKWIKVQNQKWIKLYSAVFRDQQTEHQGRWGVTVTTVSTKNSAPISAMLMFTDHSFVERVHMNDTTHKQSITVSSYILTYQSLKIIIILITSSQVMPYQLYKTEWPTPLLCT